MKTRTKCLIGALALGVGVFAFVTRDAAARSWTEFRMSIANLVVGDLTATTGGTILPATDDNVDIGSASLQFKDLYIDGVANLDNASATMLTMPSSSVSLTSPSTAITVAGSSNVIVNSDANQTGHVPTGGILNQVVTIRTGAGSNTLRFDDNGTTLALGGNITLTETQDDALILLCVEVNAVSGNQRWICLSDRSGN